MTATDRLGPGRPTTFTLEVGRLIETVVASGGTLLAAAQAAGVDRRTIWRWRRDGKLTLAPLERKCIICGKPLRSTKPDAKTCASSRCWHRANRPPRRGAMAREAKRLAAAIAPPAKPLPTLCRCGAPAVARGLCARCYQLDWKASHPGYQARYRAALAEVQTRARAERRAAGQRFVITTWTAAHRKGNR